MKKVALFVAMAVIAACGGGLGGDDNETPAPNPFAGTYQGTWTAPSTNHNGTAQITIATNGAMTGTIHDNTANADGALVGAVSNAGNVSGTVTYQGQQSQVAAGNFSFNSQNHLVGTVTLTEQGQQPVATNFDFIKQ